MLDMSCCRFVLVVPFLSLCSHILHFLGVCWYRLHLNWWLHLQYTLRRMGVEWRRLRTYILWKYIMRVYNIGKWELINVCHDFSASSIVVLKPSHCYQLSMFWELWCHGDDIDFYYSFWLTLAYLSDITFNCYEYEVVTVWLKFIIPNSCMTPIR